jgi:hypothetical protein
LRPTGNIGVQALENGGAALQPLGVIRIGKREPIYAYLALARRPSGAAAGGASIGRGMTGASPGYQWIFFVRSLVMRRARS